MNKSRGFTLLEILLVVGIIAILAGIVILALNPTKMFSQTRNVQRKANLAELNKALYQYYIDNSHYPVTLTTTLTEICATGASSTPTGIVCTGLINLSALVPTYLVAIPTDPQGSTLSLIPIAYATTNGAGYKVALNAANKVTLSAPQSELNLPVTIGDTTGVLPDHLVSYWSFDGNANDNWGSNNGTIVGATATTGVKGVANTAYAFDGVDDYVAYGDVSNLSFANNIFAFSFWMKAVNTSSLISVLGKRGDPWEYSIWSDTGGTLKFNTWESSGADVYVTSASYDTNWNHYTWTADGTNARLYKNGILITNVVKSVRNMSDTSVLFEIGRGGAAGVVKYFNGSIDNVRIYNKALSAEEVLNLYNIEKP